MVRDLRKSYGAKHAVDGVSFEIGRGEVFALLGPNGAGKTTTLEILEGYRQRDTGEVSVLDLDPASGGSLLKSRIGAMPQESGLYPTITPMEALRLFAHFYPDPLSPHELLAMVGLEEAAGTRYRRLSGGQKQRLSLALALIGRPALVFLDEPTAGLDPEGRRRTWEIVENLKLRGVTILLTTHYIEEAERLADRVAIIRAGTLIAEGSPSSLVGARRDLVQLETTEPLDVASLMALPRVIAVEGREGCRYQIEAANIPALLVEVTAWLRDSGVGLRRLQVGGRSLEDVYLELTGERGEE